MKFVGPVVALVCLAFVTGAAEARPATLSGKLTGRPIPAAGRGVAMVEALGLRDGVFAAVDYTDAKGRWAVRVPPASYALIGNLVPFRGGSVRRQLGAFVRARAGQHRTLNLSLKRKKKPSRQHRRVRAAVADGFGDVSVNYPAIWVKRFQVDDPRFKPFEKGMAEMLVVDLVMHGKCDDGSKYAVVERERLQEVLDELNRQDSPYFDPSTAVPRGHMIKDNASVTGTITHTGDQATVTATYTDRRNGYTKTVSASGAADDLFPVEQKVATQLADAVCGSHGSVVGGFNGSGTFDQTGGARLDLTWSGEVTFAFSGQSKPQQPEYSTEIWNHYTVAGGTVQLGGTGTHGDCTLSIQPSQYELLPGQGDSFDRQPEGGPGAHYTVRLTFPDNRYPIAEQKCPDSSDDFTGAFPISDFDLMYTPLAHQSSGAGVFAGSDSFNGGNYSWSLSGG